MAQVLISDDEQNSTEVTVLVVRRSKTTWHVYRVVGHQVAPPRTTVVIQDDHDRLMSVPSLTRAIANGKAQASEQDCMLIYPSELRTLEVHCPSHGLFRTNTTEAYAVESAVEHWLSAHEGATDAT
ncbi:MAG: hypothetical protein ACYDEP_02885 [Acidimicrobiales bacterium]